ncbi:MAG: alpha/beta fold hydrolase [Candidatus Bipolaricaulota bacterium]|nr:MAG: alpha/beta fold hydrolase [Candidatus Bipolaricaulota bacterium]
MTRLQKVTISAALALTLLPWVVAGQPDGPRLTPVLILPGILGSVLVDAGSLFEHFLWPGPAMLGGDIEPLRLPASGKGDLGIDVRPTGLVGYIEPLSAALFDGTLLGPVSPTWFYERLPARLRELSYYGGLIASLQTGGYVADRDLFAFPYDWRRDLLETRDLLAERVEEILAQTGAAKIDIVAHSMGGLLARAYVNSVPDPPIGKLVMMGTPSHGAPDAFVSLHSALGQGRFLLGDETAQDLSSNWPSVFQLLPSPEYFVLYEHIFVDEFGPQREGPLTASTGQGTWALTFLENEDSSIADVNMLLLSDAAHSARAFHERIGRSLTFGGELVLIAGSGGDTTGSILKTDAGAHTWYSLPTNGDGTVPLRSVTRLDSSGPVTIYHTTAGHEAMLTDLAVGKLLAAVLRGDPDTVAELLATNATLRQEQSLTDGREDEAFPLLDGVVTPLD